MDVLLDGSLSPVDQTCVRGGNVQVRMVTHSLFAAVLAKLCIANLHVRNHNKYRWMYYNRIYPILGIPDAVCRINTCGDCSIEWYNGLTGAPVVCSGKLLCIYYNL